MEKELAGVISIMAGVFTIILCLLTLYIYPNLIFFKKVMIFLVLLGFVLGLYLIVLGYKFYKGMLPSMKKSSRTDGVFLAATGLLFIVLPLFTYLSGYENPWIFIFFLGGIYYVFLGREIYLGRLSVSFKEGAKFGSM